MKPLSLSGCRPPAARPALTLALLLMLCAGCQRESAVVPIPEQGVTVSTSVIPMPERKVWHLVTADFDGDGHEDLFPAGHGGKLQDRILYRRGDRYTAGAFSFPRSPDRHGCAVGDVNGDRRPDIYCASGARRGAGLLANELWLAEGDGYRAAPDAAGAAFASSRGRYAGFLNADGDDRPDLLVTTWGGRSDDAANDSTLFLQRATGLVAIGGRESGISGRWGGRCLAIGDIDGDGLDDIAACAENEGAALFMNHGGRFQRIDLPQSAHWWMDLELRTLPGESSPSLIALTSDGGAGAVVAYQFQNDGAAPASTAGRPLRPVVVAQISLKPLFRGCFPHSLAIADGDGDNAPDLFVTRRGRGSPVRQCSGGHDGILLGPAWDRVLLLEDGPLPRSGRPATAYAANNEFLRSTAGPDWSGVIQQLRINP